MNQFATFIITNGLKASSVAKLEAKGEGGNFLFPGLPGMFTTALVSKTGSDTSPVVGWVSSGIMSTEEIEYLNAQLPGPFEYSTGEFETVVDGQPVTLREDALGFMARKGYRMKPDPVV